jgi:glutathione synthase/RimK-type ligase-like ATP-grasp enzyme
VALATCEAYRGLVPDEHRTVAALAGLGVAAAPAVWTDPAVDWRAFDAVLVRSTWDYHRQRGRFLQWIRDLAGSGVRLWNPPEVLAANTSKHYLRGLGAKGVAVPRTAWAERGAGRTLAECVGEVGAAELVFKPAVSADAYGTRRFRADEAGALEAEFAALGAREDMLVQPYLASVAVEGEWSLLYFGGRYSHAVLKRPKAGDFRVQFNHGGGAVAAEPPGRVRALADQALAAVEGETLYARVDLLRDADGAYVVQEIELTEPFLFLEWSPGAAERLALAVRERLG